MARYPEDDDDREERPSRRPARNEDDDDRPSRRRMSREESDGPAKKKLNVAGLISVILAVGSLLFAFIPCCGMFASIGAGISLILGIVGWVMAAGQNSGTKLPIAGIVLSLIAAVMSILWTFVLFPMIMGPPSTKMDGPAINITAGQLAREYDSNEFKANEDYKGKVLEVSGQVKLVSKERIGRMTVEIGSGSDTVDCDFGSSSSDLKGIEVGQTIVVKGECKGRDRKSEYVVLTGCKIVRETEDAKVPPPTTKPGAGDSGPITGTLDAKAVLAEFDKDKDAANKKYKGKKITVKGVIDEIDADVADEVQLHFGGVNGQQLVARLTKDASKKAKSLKMGQTVTIKGDCAGYQADGGDVLLENVVVQ